MAETFLGISHITRKTSNGVSHVGALQYAGQHADHIKCPHLAKTTPRANAAARGRGVSQLGASVTMVSHPPRCSCCRVSTARRDTGARYCRPSSSMQPQRIPTRRCWRWRVCDTKRCILLEMDTSNTKGEIGSAFSLFYEGGTATVTVKITILNGPGALRLEPRHKTAMRDALEMP